MKKEFSRQFLIANKGCYELSQVHELSFYSDNMTALQVANSEIPLKHKFWFICNKLCTKQENVSIAIRMAEIALPFFEKKYPTDTRPREAIEAAKAFALGNISLDTLREKRRAAAAAAYAAYAAAAAYAAYAAAAAAAAAYAAYAAYAAAKKQIIDYLIEICK